MSAIERDGIRIYYEDSGSGPAVVLTHSFLCSSEMWRPQVPLLAKEFRVVNIDLRGHGRSGASTAPFELDDLVGDVVAVMDSLGIAQALKMIPPGVLDECREQAQLTMEEGNPTNWKAAAAVIAIWLVIAVAIIYAVARLCLQ